MTKHSTFLRQPNTTTRTSRPYHNHNHNNNHFMALLSLPNELLLEIASYIPQDESWGLDNLSFFSRVNHHLHGLLTPILHTLIHSQYLLVWAIENDDHYAVALALSLGADINSRYMPEPVDHAVDDVDADDDDTDFDDTDGDDECDGHGTPTHIATRRCSKSPHSHKMYDTLVLLLEAGGRPTPGCLTSAVLADDLGLIKLLVKHGADVSKSFLAGSPLKWAVADERTHAMRLLLELGARAEDASYCLPVMHRALTDTSVEVLRILLEGGAVATMIMGGESIAEAVWNYRFKRGGPKTVEVMEVLQSHGARMPENFRAEVQLFVTQSV